MENSAPSTCTNKDSMSSPQFHPAQVTSLKLLITDYSALFSVIIISMMRILCIIKDLLRSPTTNSDNAPC